MAVQEGDVFAKIKKGFDETAKTLSNSVVPEARLELARAKPGGF